MYRKAITCIIYCLAELVRHLRGRYTEGSLKRASQIIGSLSRELERIFAVQLTGDDTFDGRHVEHRFAAYKEDVRKLLDEYSDDELFKEKRGRKLERTITAKHASEGISNAKQLKQTLKKHSKDMDEDYAMAKMWNVTSWHNALTVIAYARDSTVHLVYRPRRFVIPSSQTFMMAPNLLCT